MALRQMLTDILEKDFVSKDDTADLKETGTQFIQYMLDHIGREDAGIFPICEQSLSDGEKRDVIDGMVQLRANAKEGQIPIFTRPERSFQVLQIDLGKAPERPLFSERLLDSRHMEVKHLTIQAGHSLAAHWSPKQGTLVCLAGAGTFSANNIESPLQPGITIVMTPELKHTIQAKTDCHLLLLLQ